MSDFVVVPRSDSRLGIRRRLLALAAVGYARRLARRKPDVLERRLRRISRAARPARAEEAIAAHRAVVSVSTRCSGRWCLDRSIAIALLLRMSGAWPEWHTGVCLLPFRAHAWVTVDGEPIGEPEGLRDNFKPLMTVGAGGKNRGL